MEKIKGGAGSMNGIDTKLDMFKDEPADEEYRGESYCETLHKYHKKLWSKPLPSGGSFNLTMERSSNWKPFPYYWLEHDSQLGHFELTSDVLSTGWNNEWGRSGGEYDWLKNARSGLKDGEIELFKTAIRTIGNFIVFPKGEKNPTKYGINQARGMYDEKKGGAAAKIGDRIDLTLECIRLWYLGIKDVEQNPLVNAIDFSKDFFDLFGKGDDGFREYVKFFLLDDLVDSKYWSVKFFLSPFNGFEQIVPLPKDVPRFRELMEGVESFIIKRNKQIDDYEFS
jgi:hypothetical protein